MTLSELQAKLGYWEGQLISLREAYAESLDKAMELGIDLSEREVECLPTFRAARREIAEAKEAITYWKRLVKKAGKK